MNKSLIGLGILGLAAAAVPITILARGSGGSNGFKEPNWEGKEIDLVNSRDIKNKYQQIDCLKEYFKSGIDWYKESSNNDIDLSFSDTDDNLKGCLLVEYYKQPSTENKWWGSFKLIWTVKNNTQGFITSLYANAKEGNLKIDSSVYIVETSGNNNSWNLSFKQENSEEIISNNQELSKKLPKKSKDKFNNDAGDYWGFGPDATRVCGIEECKENGSLIAIKTQKPNRLDWQKASTGNPMSDWCANFDEWFNSLLPEGKGTKIKEKLKSLKGVWSKLVQTTPSVAPQRS